ncbi:MAG TPA: hypothetical protein K8V68_05185 [Ligilactobacillus aviarius]|nr:hypothetical protein [Ligilactobacillus aviarius]
MANTKPVRIDSELYKQLKKISLAENKRINEVGNALIKEGLERNYNMEEINKKLKEELDL